MTVLCAIADCAADQVPEQGADGVALHAVGDTPPVAIMAPAVEDVQAYQRTVAALMGTCAILPARFGTRMSSDEAAALVVSHRDALCAALSRVRGAVEVAVRARVDAAKPSAAASGAQYMLALRDRARAAGEVTTWLAPLAQISRAHARAPGRHADATVCLSYLVARDELSSFVAAVAAIDAEHPECELMCTGPWPPYSFAEAVP